MRLLPSDPDIETLVGRIEDGSLDLQPNFQRGEVWSVPKKQRLIDSVLRDWHVPPIHVVVDQSNRHLVLDGQQRLVAIRDFVNGEFQVDGQIQPSDSEIAALNGLTYTQLPEEWRRRFNQFTLRLFRITDYKPSEPGELFFRLNQPAALTAAEQRNAFFGDTREQVKQLVSRMQAKGFGPRFWGFSNARMAYDDIIARTCLILEYGSLKKKITAAALADRYRNGESFSLDVERQLGEALDLFTGIALTEDFSPAFNKATAQTWLVFAASLVRHARPHADKSFLGHFLKAFSSHRLLWPLGGGIPDHGFELISETFGSAAIDSLLHVYEDRSTSRVADTSSVSLRDFVIWIHFWSFVRSHPSYSISITPQLSLIEKMVKRRLGFDASFDIESFVAEFGWGEFV